MRIPPIFLVLIAAFAFLLLERTHSNAKTLQEPGPALYDLMTFKNKPDLGLRTDMTIIYEWEATLRDEGRQILAAGSKKKATAVTIERQAFSEVIRKRSTRYQYIIIDIESLTPKYDDIAIDYVKIAKASAPHSKIAWWNTGPIDVVDTISRPFNQENRKMWLAQFRCRDHLIRTNDFFVLGAYFKSDDSIESWRKRHLLRVTAARDLYPSKKIIVAIAPHPFNAGRPWRQVSGALFGASMDSLALLRVDGIAIWSFEGTDRVQSWSETHSWVRALRARTGPDGRYQSPMQSE